MRSGRLAKSVAAKLEKARARGERVLPSPREKRVPGPGGPQAGAPASQPARWRAGSGLSTPSRAAFKQKTSPPRAPLPARPPPAPHAGSAGVPGPSIQPSALPSGPAYLREAACPGEKEAWSPVSRGRSGGAPSPWHARRHRRRQPVALSATRPGAPGKSPHRRAAAAPHRARPPARPQLRRLTPGRWRWLPPRSLPGAGDPALKLPFAARRALTHTHSAAGWPRLGIPGRTDPFPPVFLSPQFPRLYSRLRALLAHVLARGRVGGKI